MTSISSISMATYGGCDAAARSQRSSASTEVTDLFAQVDRDGDGQWSREEFDAAVQAAAPQSFDLSAMSTQQFAGLRGQPPAPPQDPIAALDADDSGSVSAEEFGLDGASSAMQALFEAIDADADGELSTEETDAFRQQFMQQMAGADRPPPPPRSAAGEGSEDTSTTETTASEDARLRGFLQHLAEVFVGRSAGTLSASA